MLTIDPKYIPPSMKAVHIGKPFLSIAIEELKALGAKKVFVLANRSSAKFIEGEGKLMDELQKMSVLAAPLCTSIGMGGGEIGLLEACDKAYEAGADCVITVGGGAVQDAGKFIRLWLSTKTGASATVKGIQEASNRFPMPELPPQIAIPNSFAMAEATHVAGLTTTENIKSGVAHPSLMPTLIIYDATMSDGLPDWVRFGTAFRGIEHACGAVTHPKSNNDIRAQALEGLAILNENLNLLIQNPECKTAQNNIYVGGFIAVRALNTGCYPALGHLIENHYSARFNVHQGSCSGIMCARMMNYHKEMSKDHQARISEVLGDADVHAPRLVSALAAKCPGVSKDHKDENVTDEMLKEFSHWEYDNHLARLNQLSPKEFGSAEDVYGMLSQPLDNL
jgi:alcohol dehydrogenase class IV